MSSFPVLPLRPALLLVLAMVAAPSQAAGQSRIVHDTVESAALKGNLLGDSARREVLVYLPRSYDTEPERRYPVLYLLHGFTSLPSEWLDGSYPRLNLQMMTDSVAAADTLGEFIIVMPDANSRLGGGFYTNSPVAGGWADFVVRDVLGYIDTHYRTRADREDRALAGHSMGGYGALALGFQHPELFGLVYAMSPACTALVGELDSTNKDAWLAAAGSNTWEVPRTPWGLRFLVALAVAFSPAPEAPRFYGRLPFEPDASGRLHVQVRIFERWLKRMPLGLAVALRRSKAPLPEIYIEYGVKDQISSVAEGVRLLTQALHGSHAPYVLTTFDGGHVDQMPERIGGYLLPTVGRFFQKGRD